MVLFLTAVSNYAYSFVNVELGGGIEVTSKDECITAFEKGKILGSYLDTEFKDTVFLKILYMCNIAVRRSAECCSRTYVINFFYFYCLSKKCPSSFTQTNAIFKLKLVPKNVLNPYRQGVNYIFP